MLGFTQKQIDINAKELDEKVAAISQSMKVDSLNLDNWELKVRENYATIVKEVYRDEK